MKCATNQTPQLHTQQNVANIPTFNRFETLDANLCSEGTPQDPPDGEAQPPSQSEDQSSEKPVDLLIITSSIAKRVKGNRLYSYCDRTTSVKVLADKTVAGARAYIKATTWNPKVVHFFIGGNDLTTGTVSDVTKELELLLTETRVKFSSSDIIFSEILPRELNTDSDFNQKKDSVNDKMKVMCDPRSKLHFMQQRNLLDKSHRLDGVHLRNKSLGLLVGNIKTIVNPLLGLEPYVARGGDSTQRTNGHITYRQESHKPTVRRGPSPQRPLPHEKRSWSKPLHQEQRDRSQSPQRELHGRSQQEQHRQQWRDRPQHYMRERANNRDTYRFDPCRQEPSWSDQGHRRENARFGSQAGERGLERVLAVLTEALLGNCVVGPTELYS